VCNDCVPDPAVVTRLWTEQSKFQVSARARGFFFCRKTATNSGAYPSSYSVSTSNYSQGYDFRGVKPTTHLYWVGCTAPCAFMDGQGQLHVVLRRCHIKQCYQLCLVLALAELEVAKRACTFRSLCPLGRAPGICYKQENSMWIVEKRELWIVTSCLWWTWKCLRCSVGAALSLRLYGLIQRRFEPSTTYTERLCTSAL